jgi:hypothetical protein
MAVQPKKIGNYVIMTAVIVITASVVFWGITQWTGFNPFAGSAVVTTPEGEVIAPDGVDYFYEHGGQLKITLKMYNEYNNTLVSATRPAVTIYHAKGIDFSAPSGNVFGTMDATTDNVTHDLWVSDEGVLYLVIDHGTSVNDWFIAPDNNLQYAVSGPTEWDHDGDGTYEYMWKIDVKELPRLQAGESIKNVAMNLYLTQADESFDIASDYNVTGVTNTEWTYVDSAIYVSLDKGHAVKMNKLVLDLTGTGSNANHTLIDNNSVQIQYAKLVIQGGKSYTFDSFTFSKAGKEVVFDLGDYVESETQEFYGIPIYRDVDEGVRFATLYLRIKAKFDQSDGFVPDVKASFIDSVGTITTKSQLMDFGN